MANVNISVADLVAANLEAVKKFRRLQRLDRGLGCLGLIMDETPDASRCDWCTPTNCITFASTGGNGVHFSVMTNDTSVTEDSPAIVTNPGGGLGVSWIVGETLYDFLCFGYYRGYFALEQLAYKEETTLEVYTNPHWKPTEEWHDSVGYTLENEQRTVLDFLIARCHLRPWTKSDHFQELQARFVSQLQFPSRE